jgi:hypothetical protein
MIDSDCILQHTLSAAPAPDQVAVLLESVQVARLALVADTVAKLPAGPGSNLVVTIGKNRTPARARAGQIYTPSPFSLNSFQLTAASTLLQWPLNQHWHVC